MAVEEVGAGANGINWVEARWSLARHLVHPVIMSCKSGFRAPTKLLTCCSFAQKLNCCWQCLVGGGVQQSAVGPFQRRLQEIGGITPLVFGQYGELSASFEALIDTLAINQGV